MIMSSGDRDWDHQGVEPEVEAEQAQGMFGKRRLSALAAVVALAAVAGALGGALATAGVMHFAGGASTASSNLVLEASVARIDADILALKAGVEQTSKVGIVRDNKASDRLDKVEKAQAEPAAKLARLSEAVEKLKAAQVGAGRGRPGGGQGCHRLDLAPGNGGGRRTRSVACTQTRSGAAADGRGLGAARSRQWRRADRGTAGNL